METAAASSSAPPPPPVLAPVASIEDLSDGESPPGRMGDRGLLAAPSKAGGGGGGVAPPRIDISRASSSSHHDDSSPERELFAGNDHPHIILSFHTVIIHSQGVIIHEHVAH
ncbi:hypothetical protein LSTR_LSTR017194 [Laodelphax striatellus]|uniref:Uncharacterized protein n=1 Tax=Laodelphax striatellus TaxID=195883 RepID=A0A482XMD2_LAOST|nr:hypothetical protein LSTR_LSTR017194 [Laodelphax striatellus]